MRKSRSFVLGALTLGALMAWGNGQPEGAVAEICFICDDYVSPPTGEGQWYHNDCPLFYNDQHGVKHPCGGGTPGMCLMHPNYAGGGGPGGPPQ